MKIFGSLTKWQNYLHYILLSLGVVLIAHPFSTYLGIEQWFVLMIAKTGFMGFFAMLWAYLVMIMYYAFMILLLDIIICTVFYYLPRPWQWRE